MKNISNKSCIRIRLLMKTKESNYMFRFYNKKLPIQFSTCIEKLFVKLYPYIEIKGTNDVKINFLYHVIMGINSGIPICCICKFICGNTFNNKSNNHNHPFVPCNNHVGCKLNVITIINKKLIKPKYLQQVVNNQQIIW